MSEINAIATNNYLLATPIGSGYMETSALEYDGDKISGYAGSAFKAGDEFPQSATDAIGYVTATSANIDSTIDNVSANSGVWGGSALPISAGPGIKFEMVDNTLVASTDETVIFNNDEGTSTNSFSITEPMNNFEEIKLLVKYNNAFSCPSTITYPEITGSFRIAGSHMCPDNDGAPLQIYGISYSSNNGIDYNMYRTEMRWFDYNNVTSVNGLSDLVPTIYKILGVTRKS